MSGVDPLPLDLVLSGRDVTEPRLSPDATQVGFVYRWGSRSAISTVGLDPPSPERLLTFGPDPAPGRGMGGGCFAWTPSEGIVYCADDGELWSVDRARAVPLTTHARTCRAPAVDTLGSFVVYAVDEAEIWISGLLSGRARRLDDGRHAFCFDPAISPDGSTVSWIGWSPPDMPWDGAQRVDARLTSGSSFALDASSPSTGDADGADTDVGIVGSIEIVAWRPEDGAVQQARFAPDGTATCVHDATGWLNVYAGSRNVLDEPVEHAGPTWGMGQRSYVTTPAGAIVIARNECGFGTLTVVDDAGPRDLVDGFTGVYGHLTAAAGRVCALRSGPTTPPEIVVVDAGRVRPVVVSGAAAWASVDLPDPVATTVAHDGTTLHSRLYRSGADTGRLLCWVHGGPTDQWPVEFRPRLSYWSSRGWDVLVVDPRGSTGHGRTYQRTLNGAWGRIDVDDTAAVIADLHRQGTAAPESTVVIGGSSGGLTVLGVLADHPDLVAGGIASYPVSDLGALARSTHRFEAHYTDTLVGPADSPVTAELLHSLSPLHRAERIRRPLLIVHGTDDPVVPIGQSDALVARVRAAGGDVEYAVYEGEGHGLRDPTNQRDEYERMERFLERIVALPASAN